MKTREKKWLATECLRKSLYSPLYRGYNFNESAEYNIHGKEEQVHLCLGKCPNGIMILAPGMLLLRMLRSRLTEQL